MQDKSSSIAGFKHMSMEQFPSICPTSAWIIFNFLCVIIVLILM